MKPADFVHEFFYPLTHLAPFVTITTFALLNLLAVRAGAFGLWLAVVVLPATIRYQMLLLEARAKGVDPNPPDIESFSFVGNAWSLFPLVHYGLSLALLWAAYSAAGETGVVVAGVALAATLPAALAVLAITQSPLASLNPVTVVGLIGRVRTSYWAIPAALLLTGLLYSSFFGQGSVPGIIANVYLSFSIFSVIGGVIRPYDFFAEVDIEAPIEPEPEKVIADLEASRTGVLNHAYGFASRGNVDGALGHLRQWLAEKDPYPGDAWPWFFERMLGWDNSYPALKLAQDYFDVLLAAGEYPAAMKLVLRCRHASEAFRPHRASLPRAIEAAEAAGNDDLATWFRAL